MRCIEIFLHFQKIQAPAEINRNMRCIEIAPSNLIIHYGMWLIETWDVLKYNSFTLREFLRSWLIETWDVLK